MATIEIYILWDIIGGNRSAFDITGVSMFADQRGRYFDGLSASCKILSYRKQIVRKLHTQRNTSRASIVINSVTLKSGLDHSRSLKMACII